MIGDIDTAPSPPRKTRILAQAITGAVILALFIVLAWYITSPQFVDWVRGRVVSRLEDMTGGRIELGQLRWSASRLQVVAENLTIHGLEGPGDVPYAHADRIVIDATVLSVFQRKIGLRYLELDRPIVHIIVYPDGRTNQPTPRGARKISRATVDTLFDLQVERAEIRNGVLLLNDRPIPLELAADDVTAGMSYVRGTQQYDGSINVGRLRSTLKDFRTFDSAASAAFTLSSNRLDLKSVRLSSGQSFVDVTGRLVEFSDPQLTLNYHASFNLTEFANVLRIPQARRGVVDLRGSGAYTSRDYSSSGKLTLRNVEYRDANIHIPDLSGEAEYRAGKAELALPRLSLQVLGGSIVGDAVVRDWLIPQGAAEQQGTAHLRLQNLAFSRILAAISSKSLPLDRLKAVGSSSGTARITWRAAPSRARVEFAATVVPPSQAPPDQLPVTATFRGEYLLHAQQLQLVEMRLAGRSLEVSGSGTMERRAQLRLAAKVGNIRDIYPLLSALQAPQQLPPGIEGGASFTGVLAGRLSAPEISGRLALNDFTVPVPLWRPAIAPAQPPRAPRLTHFDSLVTDIQYSPSQLTLLGGVLRRGSEQMNFAVSAGLQRGRLQDNGPITARLAVRGFDVADLQGLIGYDYPVSGVVNGNLQLTGTTADPRGSGRLHVSNARVYGEPFQSIEADLLFAAHEAQAHDIVVAHNGARVTGAAAYNLQTRAFKFDLVGTNFNLAQFRQLQTKKVSFAGLLNFTARGSGTPETPVIDFDTHVRNLVMNGEQIGSVDATAVTTAGIMRINGRSNFRTADLGFSGTVGMRGDFPLDLQLRMAHFDVDPFLKMFFKGRVTGHSSIGGVVTISGPLRQPRLVTLRGDIGEFAADIEHMRIQNDGPLRFSMANQLLQLDQFRLMGAGTTLSATGTVALNGRQAMNLHAEGHVNLQMLQTFNPDLHASGTADFNVSARGTLTRPALLGRLNIADGSIAHINFPNGLSDINGVLIFNQDRMQIQSLSAKSGGGSATLNGFVTYGNGLAFNIGASGRDIRLRYPQGTSTNLNADLQLTGTLAASTLSGSVMVTRFSMTPQFDLALYAAKSRQPPEVPNPASPLNNMRLNIHVTSTPDLMVTTSLAKVSGDADFNVRGTATRPVLLGRINITEGQVTFNGTNYQLDRGDVSFSNPVRIEPVVDVEVTTRVRDYDVTLGFHGPIDRLSTTYRSDPPLPTADIISLLAFGKTREESAMTTEPNPSFTESASNAILGQALNAAVSSRVQRLFGVSRVKIAPEVGGAETNPNARVTIEQQVSKDFTVTYITDLTHSAQQTIEVEYNYSRSLSIRASRDQYGIVAFSVRIRQRKK